MCTNINVNLPTVTSFLLLYSLRCGCVVILIWTVFRSLFFLIFFVLAIIETFLPRPPPLGPVFMTKPPPPALDEHYYFVFMGHLVMIVTECFVLMFTIYLGMGLYYETPSRINQYLVCRFCTWLCETTFLVILCLTHYNLIGWYLAFLMFVILEFYAFIVVYSYYMDMLDEDEEKDDPMDDEIECPPPKLCPCAPGGAKPNYQTNYGGGHQSSPSPTYC